MSKITYAGPLAYNNGIGIVKEGDFRISASGISRFFSNTNAWWRENMMGETGFISSTASVLGTCVHYVAEVFAKTGTFTDQNKQEVEDYIVAHTNPAYTDYNEEVDGDIIRTQYKIMAQNIVNEYLINNIPTQVELFVTEEILPGIFVGGSIDAITNDIVCDYKTTSMTKLPETIKFEYRLQLLTYAWIMRKQGTTINRIRIIYVSRDKPGAISEKTGRQLKSYPSEVKVITENVTEEDFEYIQGIINMISHSVQRWNEVPEDRYLLAQDWRLKEGVTNAQSKNIFTQKGLKYE